MLISKQFPMSKKICSDTEAISVKSTGRKSKYYCKKCGERVVKEKWACKPEKIKESK
jgi:tRNA(Ile2) C34 agmatinyltransferase TiaS